ncbi:MAG: hypothetical protein IPP90_13160 [Gemmatimonadaceae bacterium]|nr:hypothetical protein [Gemmatimonadaceae bacterium]
MNATSMIRRSAHRKVGGYDESMKLGLEDWDFWLKSASAGNWGTCIPEFLDWYRRRTDHTDRWEALNETRIADFLTRCRVRYPELWNGRFPRPILRDDDSVEQSDVRETSDENLLRKQGTRLLVLVPCARGEEDERFSLEFVRQLVAQGLEVSVVMLQSDLHLTSAYCQATPDVFALPHFLAVGNYPRFLQYLVSSRQIDGVVVTDSDWGWPSACYLRAVVPALTCVHMGDARVARSVDSGEALPIALDRCLDLCMVPSQLAKRQMIEAELTLGA